MISGRNLEVEKGDKERREVGSTPSSFEGIIVWLCQDPREY
jgi:hypothetical protein